MKQQNTAIINVIRIKFELCMLVLSFCLALAVSTSFLVSFIHSFTHRHMHTLTLTLISILLMLKAQVPLPFLWVSFVWLIIRRIHELLPRLYYMLYECARTTFLFLSTDMHGVCTCMCVCVYIVMHIGTGLFIFKHLLNSYSHLICIANLWSA